MIDLLGHEIQPKKRANDRPEAAALVEVLKAVKTHPLVAWAERQNSGAARIGVRFVRFGWPGCPDVLRQLKDGRLLGVEVKAAKGRASPEQTPSKPCLSSVSIKRVAWHSLPVTYATCCVNWGRYDLPELHTPP